MRTRPALIDAGEQEVVHLLPDAVVHKELQPGDKGSPQHPGLQAVVEPHQPACRQTRGCDRHGKAQGSVRGGTGGCL